MSEALVTTRVIHPSTGEALELDRPLDDLAAFIADVRDLESRLREAKGQVSREILRRFDRDAKWSAKAGDYEVKGDGPGKVEYDGEKLAEALIPFVVDGTISKEAAQAACEEITSFKARRAGINSLKKLGGDIAEAIQALEEPVPDDKRRVSVGRKT